ncbi:hypothetical protein EG328_009635 [Venturia inaequalis]|uniref:Uncharacterized protein n=1 Tax=Venturia inaequalis TaxID=5025 RepID=A0A8H3Z586_VENIN|nr:hypothetical protein EG328_009635 [Venturia inaequalis]
MNADVQERADKELEIEEQFLLQARVDTPQQTQPRTGLATLPTELVDCIFEYVAAPQSIFPFLFSRTFHAIAIRVLYRELRIEVCSNVQMKDGSALKYREAATEPPTTILHASSLIASKLLRMGQMVQAHMASLAEKDGIEQGEQLRSPSLLTRSRSISAALFTDQFTQELADHRVFIDNAFVKCLEREIGPSSWGGWLDRILSKALDTKLLACDVLPGMWGTEVVGSQATPSDITHMDKDQINDRHLRPRSMQNLHTLCLRGFHGHVLELQLSSLPNLRTLKIRNIQIRDHNQIGLNGITKLETFHTQAPLSANGISICSDFGAFTKLKKYRSVILPPAAFYTRHHINTYFSKLRMSADALTKIELILLGRWIFNYHPSPAFSKTFNALTTLRLPSTKLKHLTTLTPVFGVDPSTIQRIEVVVHCDHAGGLFDHLLVDFVSFAIVQLKPHFPNLAMVKLALADTAGKGLCRDTQLFLAVMDHVVRRGAFMKHKVVIDALDSRALGSIKLDNGLVIDYFDLMKYMARTPKLESLACDFFPSMWTDLDLDTYDMIPWLQNLHTLSLHGFRSLLGIRLSRLPNLRKLKLVNIGLLPSVDICKVTDLELEYSLCTRIQKAGPEIRNFMFPSCWYGVQLSGFNNLARLRITLSYLGRLRKSVRTQDLSICAATLRELELNVLGHWPPPVHPSIDERVKLPSLTNLIIPWARLAITGKSPLLDTPAVQKVEIRLTDPFDNPHDFANDLVDFLTDEQVSRAFPSLRTVKITVEEPGNKKWRTEIRSIMEHIERESIGGSLGGIPFIKRDEFLKGCIELQLGDRGGLVLDLSGIFICLMMHDATVNWSSLP